MCAGKRPAWQLTRLPGGRRVNGNMRRMHSSVGESDGRSGDGYGQERDWTAGAQLSAQEPLQN